MSANEIATYVLLFSNQEWTDAAVGSSSDSLIAQLSPNISFAQDIQDGIQTLSTQNVDPSGSIMGFLYVPDLPLGDPCYNISKNYIPSNVTRQVNLPPTDYTLVSIAPWINAQCTLSFLQAARSDPTRAFVFYLPDNGTDQPPDPSSSTWDLGDGGMWKSKNQYPVYAIPGNIGQELLRQTSLYSGNMTSVPYGHDISEIPHIDPRDYVRLYTQINTSNTSSLPSFWVLILVVAAVLLSILGLTSASMHLIQRSRRNSLRRRVASGEVNLEALGIKRLTVPHSFIDDLPLFIYSDEGEKPPMNSPDIQIVPAATSTQRDVREDSSPSGKSASNSGYTDSMILDSEVNDETKDPTSSLPHKFLPYSQPTCPICLDDYVSGTTEIRELPCGHIFHPECIDIFLGTNSSLCPMCKQSALPLGYCPENITNAMVYRERNIRRLRTRVRVDDNEANVGFNDNWSQVRHLGSRIKRAATPHASQAHQMSTVPTLQPIVTTNLPAAPQPSVLGYETAQSPTRARQEIISARIRDLLSRQTPIQDPDALDERQRPKWRQTIRKAFPGF